jgi:hypothetical protein
MKFLFKIKYFSSNSNDIPLKYEELPKITYTLGKNFLKNTTFLEYLI